MNRSFVSVPLVALVALFTLSNRSAHATTLPYTEDFSTNVANWADNSAAALLTHLASGGPDGGGFASSSLPVTGLGGTSVVVFRGQDEFNSSGHAFEGNWIADGVGRFSAYVRHNAPQPLTYFTRFSGPGNFPGATAVQFAPVPPQTWTQLSFNVSAANPAFVTYEGTSFGTVFSNIGHVQIGVSVPAALSTSTTPISFGLDKVSIVAVPEPANWMLAAGAIAVFVIGPRRREHMRKEPDHAV